MNRFKVDKASADAFETLWKTRESYLDEVDGFVAFHLLRGPDRDDHILYSSHTVWRDHEAFIAWTKSEAFRKAHATAGDGSIRSLYNGAPEFEGFTVIQELTPSP
ncbi:MAG: antibiotic biosynthesis monooxygenase [Pseudomonadota bacterium]